MTHRMQGLFTILAGSLFLVALIQGARLHEPTEIGTGVGTRCLTEADVSRDQARSRNGISLTCTETLRQRELAR